MAPSNNAAPSIVSCSRFGLASLLAVSHLLLLSTTTIAPPVSSFALLPAQTSVTRRATTEWSPLLKSTSVCRMTAKSSEASSSSSSSKSSPSPAPTERTSEVRKQLERAKAALEMSRAKMEAQDLAADGFENEIDEEKESIPFFAAAAVENKSGKKEQVIKNKNEDGTFSTDGDLMAKLSEEEEWDLRPLLEVFKNEKEKEPQSLNVDRDIGQSMYNLRKVLQTEDFTKIFDKRNRFIGDP